MSWLEVPRDWIASLTNVLLRIEQFRQAADAGCCLRLAQQFVRGKIHNHRVFFMRNHVSPPGQTKLRMIESRLRRVSPQDLALSAIAKRVAMAREMMAP